MDFFNYRDHELYAEEISAKTLAERFGTPLYVYSKATLEKHFNAFDDALGTRRHLICYAVKANGSLAILNLMARLGAGFDVVSEGELRRVMAAGGDPHRTVFSGVGKTEKEIAFALKTGVCCLNIESEAELWVVSKIAADLKIKAPVALRVNPDVDPKTLPAISTGLKNNKFGIPKKKALKLYHEMALDKNLRISGIDCHIGSQMISGTPILEAAERLLALCSELKRDGIEIDHIDLGGGLGVTYRHENPPSPYDYFQALGRHFEGSEAAIFIEPGRAMVANAGLLLCRVLYLKHNGVKRFCIADAGMNDLLRPALYDSWMNIVNVEQREDGELRSYDVVGPVCESDDYLGKSRKLNLQQGDILAVRGAGAYGSSMSSTYNGRPLACEVMVDGDRAVVIRKRQQYEELWANEIIPDYPEELEVADQPE